eukprot:TRINITY_DN1354_c0_g1_i1.p1 TRINITY_DN1354_c0_g1~~TRINITY_DN1354_c0_g1_i1.p1  ORF type:complete len:112 (-),score=18.44 TRINITY_DN1354_c0_g1_i1:340-675(-)
MERGSWNFTNRGLQTTYNSFHQGFMTTHHIYAKKPTTDQVVHKYPQATFSGIYADSPFHHSLNVSYTSTSATSSSPSPQSQSQTTVLKTTTGSTTSSADNNNNNNKSSRKQ